MTTIASLTTNPYSGQILNHQEARARIQQLPSGSKEQLKLQEALLKTNGIVEVILSNGSYKVHTARDCTALGGFGSSEHVAIGESVELPGLPEADAPLLVVDRTIPVQFHQIVALAGDFYGVPGNAISLPGGTDEEKTQRFQQFFNTLAEADSRQLEGVIREIELECAAVKESGLPHHCYSSQMTEKNRAIKRIKNDVDDLLIDNSDHFCTNAKDAYRIGHALAMKVAAEAGGQKNVEELKRAYALDAFACHFLTDLFASGHIRNQRGPLENVLISLGFPQKVGCVYPAKLLAGILTGAQHEKDGHDGLNVTNGLGEHWRAYGDGCFFQPKNEENKRKVEYATQTSVGEVYAAYCNPEVPPISEMDKLIPEVSDFNPSPIYSIEEGSLFLYQEGEKVKITQRRDYLEKAILTEALRYLPEEYINAVLKSFIPAPEIPPIINQVFIPQVERFTGTIWHVVGVATYHQAAQENQQLNSKIDEMANIISATYDKTKLVLKQIEVMDAKLDQLIWSSRFKEIEEAIAIIKDVEFTFKQNKQPKSNQIEDLNTACDRMLRVFSVGTANNTNILADYQSSLQASYTDQPLGLKMAVTFWYRQMIDYQVCAFSILAITDIMTGIDKGEVCKKANNFESHLMRQIKTNQLYIDESLIHYSQAYIALQEQKRKTRKLAIQELNLPQ